LSHGGVPPQRVKESIPQRRAGDNSPVEQNQKEKAAGSSQLLREKPF
jgi:hypothetical protein